MTFKPGDKVKRTGYFGNTFTDSTTVWTVAGTGTSHHGTPTLHIREVGPEYPFWDAANFELAGSSVDPLEGLYIIRSGDFDPEKHERQHTPDPYGQTIWTSKYPLRARRDPERMMIVRDKPLPHYHAADKSVFARLLPEDQASHVFVAEFGDQANAEEYAEWKNSSKEENS